MQQTMDSINPATGKSISRFKCIEYKEAAEEARKCREAFEEWKGKPVSERIKAFRKAGAILRQNSREYGELMALEMGKPIKQAIAEIEKCAWACDYYFENAEKFLADQIVETDNNKSVIVFEPLGVILGIMPWNFPFWQVFRFAVPALAAGNACILKHASNVPGCAIEIEKVFSQAGLPKNIFRTLLINGKIAGMLIENGLVEGVSLTGSVEAGSKVAETAGRNLKKAVLELGGSDPFIVLDDADLESACGTAVNARFQNNGQSCVAAKRFIVHQKIASEFRKKFIDKVGKLIVGNPLEEKTDIGPLARDDLRDALEKQIEIAVRNGAKILVGGKRISRDGYFFEPTLVEMKADNPIASEEVFGPVGLIMVGKDEEELIKIANSTEFGLGASIWTRNLKKGEELARRVEAGMVFVNSMVKSDPRLPFGGIKKSGIGRELSEYGIKEFVNIKSVVIS